eukprot:TRINITY_DN2512_c0_g1_i4.p1 TRINITY_DN2512_c0_g1~~TRINITY_DN2512_c0_g1_i4.p1  ORF type:complete len:364 (-),score=84.54 TRINITY_DN2512_c0_g1_i4:55-1146(-)
MCIRDRFYQRKKENQKKEKNNQRNNQNKLNKGNKKIQELKKFQLSKTQKIIQKEKLPEIIKVNQNKITNSDVVLSKHKTEQQKYALSLEGQEQALDKQVETLESKSDKYEYLSDSIDEESIIIEQNLQKLIIEEQKIVKEKNLLIIQKDKLENQIKKCRIDFTKSSHKFITLKEKQFRKMCMLNKDKFREEKYQLDHQINAYTQLQHQLLDEKHQYKTYQKTLVNIKTPNKTMKINKKPNLAIKSLLQKSMKTVKQSSNPEFDRLLSSVKGNVIREALWKNINQVLIVVSELAEDNAKQAIIIDRKMEEAHLNEKDKMMLMQSIKTCLLYTSDAADEEDSVDLGGRRIIKKKKNKKEVIKSKN